MNLVSDIDNTTLQVLESRLKNSVSQLDIIKWLNNFKPFERQMALDIAMNLTVFDTYEVESVLHSSFKKAFPRINKNDRIIVLPVGDFGKSGSMIAYFFQKTSFFGKYKNSPKVQLVSHLSDNLFENGFNYKLVLIDDFAGSGQSINTFFQEELAVLNNHFNETHFIGIASMQKAKALLTTFIDKVHIPESNVFERAFGRSSHYFGYRNYGDYREFCYKYGKRLTKLETLKNGSEKHTHALGFKNSQALVSFSYGSPNNTLPIIWASKDGWIPLIPRFSKDKMSISKNFRKTLSHEMSILKEFSTQDVKRVFFTLEIENQNKSFKGVSKIDFSIYGIIKLMRNGHKAPTICQKLGILSSDYDEMIRVAIQRSLLNQSGNLTSYGLKIYQDAKRTIKNKNQEIEYDKADFFAFKKIEYKPKQFNGRS